MTSSTGTSSTTESPFSESSSLSSYQQQIAPQYTPCPHANPIQSNEHWWQKPETVIAIMGMALTGVVGYFSATLPIRDAISDNLSRVKVIEAKISHLERALQDNKKYSEIVQNVDKEVAVIKVELEQIKIRQNNNR